METCAQGMPRLEVFTQRWKPSFKKLTILTGTYSIRQVSQINISLMVNASSSSTCPKASVSIKFYYSNVITLFFIINAGILIWKDKYKFKKITYPYKNIIKIRLIFSLMKISLIIYHHFIINKGNLTTSTAPVWKDKHTLIFLPVP